MTNPREQHSPYMRALMPDKENRDVLDYYPTPPGATRALLSVENFSGIIWEPACGEGHMSKVLKETGCHVVSTDLVQRSYQPMSELNFLTSAPLIGVPEWETVNVVTNPPFKHALEFAEKGLEVSSGKVALLCRLMFLESMKRKEFFQSSPLARVWVFSDRVPFQRGRLQGDDEPGGKTTPYAWFVWQHGHIGPPTLGWISYKENLHPK